MALKYHIESGYCMYASMNGVIIGLADGLSPTPMMTYCQLDPTEQTSMKS